MSLVPRASALASDLASAELMRAAATGSRRVATTTKADDTRARSLRLDSRSIMLDSRSIKEASRFAATVVSSRAQHARRWLRQAVFRFSGLSLVRAWMMKRRALVCCKVRLIVELDGDERHISLVPGRTSAVAKPLIQQPGRLVPSTGIESDRGDQRLFRAARSWRTATGSRAASSRNRRPSGSAWWRESSQSAALSGSDRFSWFSSSP